MVLGGGEVQCIRRLQAESRTQMGTVGEHHRRHRQLNKLRQPLFVISLQLQLAIAQRSDQTFELHPRPADRTRVVSGKSVAVRVDTGGGGMMKKKTGKEEHKE